jgi:hypothetical protein
MAAVVFATAAGSTPALAQSTHPLPLIDVPYLPQSEALCGGAAIAMVMRYWGETGVYAETFSDLIDPEAQGIRGRELMRALEERGYETASFEGDLDQIRRTLAARRPAVALIEDRPGRFHYVVIVGLRDERIVVHDPARSPFRVIEAAEFLHAWAPAKAWMMIAQPRAAGARPLPRADGNAGADASDTSMSNSLCAGMVEEGVRLSGRGDLAASERVFRLATTECPDDPGPWRELAGVHVLRGDWRQASAAARLALDRDPQDQHAIRILATSLFLSGARDDALNVWNRIESPVIDLVEIRGLEQTRYAVAAKALDLAPQTLLTSGRLQRARKRLDAIPSILGSHVSYEPDENENAKVVAAVVERPVVPAGLISLAAIGARMVSDRVLRVDLAGPAGEGELWSGAWRWWENRPRVEFGMAAPSPFGGVWSLVAFGEKQTYGGGASEIVERRRGLALKATDWLTGSTRLRAGVSFDRWPAGMTTALNAGVARAFDEDRGRASVDATLVAGAFETAVLALNGEWQSANERMGPVWLFRAGVTRTGNRAPFALWPGAGVGQGRDLLLRAHSLLHDGVIRGVFGRQVSHGGVEWRDWRWSVLRTVRIAPAMFLDVARADRVPAFGDDRAHVDVGAGLRIAVPGAGVLRIDLGRGLRDGSTALSIGWGPS